MFFPEKYKESYLVHVLNEHISKSKIIFTITCKQSMKVCLLLRNLGFDAIPLHGKMS